MVWLIVIILRVGLIVRHKSSRHCTSGELDGGGKNSANNHLLFVIFEYHPPKDDYSLYISISSCKYELETTNPISLFLICLDFTCDHASWLGVSSARRYSNSLNAIDRQVSKQV